MRLDIYLFYQRRHIFIYFIKGDTWRGWPHDAGHVWQGHIMKGIGVSLFEGSSSSSWGTSRAPSFSVRCPFFCLLKLTTQILKSAKITHQLFVTAIFQLFPLSPFRFCILFFSVCFWQQHSSLKFCIWNHCLPCIRDWLNDFSWNALFISSNLIGHFVQVTSVTVVEL